MRMRAGQRTGFLSTQKSRVRLGALLATAAAAALAQSAHAQVVTATWTNPAGGSWTNAADWKNGVIPTKDGDTADFSTLTLPADATVTLDGSQTAGVLRFGDVGNAHNWFVNSGSNNGNLTLSNVITGGAATITVNNGTATFNAPVTTAATPAGMLPSEDLTTGGNGTVVFNGGFTGQGNLTVNGTAQFTNLVISQDTGGSTSAGPGPNSLTIAASVARVTGTLFLQGSQSANVALITGPGTLQLRNAGSSFANPSISTGLVPNSNADCGIYIQSNLDVGNSGTQWIVGNSNHNNFSVHDGDLVFQGNLSGSANIAYSGAPYNGDPFSLVFSGDNHAWTGGLNIVSGSFVPYSTSSTDLGIGGNNAVTFSPAAGQSAIFYLYGQNVSIGSLSGGGAGQSSIRNAEWMGHTNSNHDTHLSAATLTVNQTSNGTYSGTLADGPSDRSDANAVYFPLSLVKTGPATLTLTGNNTYTGGTTVNGGTLEIAGTAAGVNPLGSGAIAVNQGGTLKLTQSNIFGNGVSVPQSITVDGGTLTNNNSFNALGPVTLHGGTIAANAGLTPGQFEAFSLNGTVSTLASSAASMLTSNVPGSGFHLSANTVFDVAQGTAPNGQDLIVSGNLLDQNFDQAAGSRAGGLTKMGAGTMVLSGHNSYTGATTVNAGTLLITGTNASTAPITVNAGTLAVGASASLASNTIKIASGAHFDASAGGYTLPSGQTLIAGHTSGAAADVLGNLTVGSGSILDVGGVGIPATLSLGNAASLTGGTLRLDLGSPGGAGNDLIAVSGNLSLSETNSVLVSPTQSSLAAGKYTLMTYGGTLTGGASNLAISSALGATRQTFSFDTSSTPGSVLLNVSGQAASLIWAGGSAANAWDLNTTANWKNQGAADKFFSLDQVTFDDTGSNTPAINITGTVSPGSITVNSSHDYTFGGSGSIAGGASLTKSGSGTLTINNTNSFAGPVTINGGVLVTGGFGPSGTATPIGSGTTVNLGAGTLRYTGPSVSSDRAFTLNNAASSIEVTTAASNLSLTGSVSGAGGLTKLGAGILSLAGGNTFAGPTVVSGGTLALAADSSLGAAPASAQAAAVTLGGGNLQFTGSATLNANRGILLSSSATIDTQANTVTIPGPISGTVPTFTKAGSGTLALTGANTYSANTVVSGGTLQVPGDAGLGTAPGGLVANSLTLTGGGTVAVTADTSFAASRGVTLGAGGGGFSSGGHAVTLSAPIAGGGPLKLGGGGTYTLNSASTYTGGTVVDPAVTSLTINVGPALGTGPLTFQGPTNFEVDTGDTVPNDITLTATGTFTKWETLMGNTPTLSGKITGGNNSLKLEFNLSDSNGEGGIALTNPNNSFTAGTIDLNRGRIGVGASGALGNPKNLLFLDDTISGDTVAGAGLHFLAPNINIPNPIQFNDYSNINVNGHDGDQISGNISGPAGNRGQDYYVLGAVQNGGTSAGSLRLSGNNTFTQNITIDPDATLIAGSPTALGTKNTITASGGSTIGFDGAGVNTDTTQTLNVSGNGAVTNGVGRGVLLNINGSNTYGGNVVLGSDSTFAVANAADTLTLGNNINVASFNLTKIGPGTLAIAGGTATGTKLNSLTINGGAVKIGGAAGAAGPLVVGGSVTINTGSSLKLPAVGPKFTSSIAGTLTLSNGSLDVGTSAVTLDDTANPLATVQQELKSGYSAGTWNGAGINTSAGDASHGLGYADAADGVVAGQPAKTVLIKYTVLGDANLNGQVGFDDLVTLARHYGLSNVTWDQGDFNYDGTVGFDDLVSLARNYGQKITAAQLAAFTPAFRDDVEKAFAEAAADVPEPAMLGLLSAAALIMLQRRRRGSH